MYSLLGLFPFFLSCSDEVDKNNDESSVPILLSGSMTRAGEPARNNIYVKGFYAGTTKTVYFDETLANIPEGLSTTNSNPIEFSGASPCYPPSPLEINIIAYSGKAPDGKMYLTAGTTIDNDAILSNYGKRKSDADYSLKYEPSGTIGSSSDQIDYLQFRHVMTQLNVDFELDPNSQVDHIPKTIHFTLKSNAVVKTGRYSVKEKEADPAGQQATNLSNDSYTIQLGTNYLVPSGADLFGIPMQTLTIDDYTASGDELAGYTIGSNDGATSMELRPGYSYKLTLTISRLRLTDVKLTKSDWVPVPVSGNLKVTPYTLGLNLGAYDTSQRSDTISSVVLMTENKQYVGKSIGGQIQFATLPTVNADVKNVVLYTTKGCLINKPLGGSNTYTYNTAGSNLTLNLSAGGLMTADGNPVSPTNPYLITTAVQFVNVSKEPNANYKQMATVDLNTLNLVGANSLFNGFGDFSGTFDGNGYRIDGINIQAPGLFESNSGTLKNIRLTTGIVDGAGSAYAGSIAGTNSGSIIACVNEAQIVNSISSVTIYGGIAGLNQSKGEVVACVNTGSIKQGDIVGGIVGENQNTDENAFVACINTGALNPAATYLGYLCGKSNGTMGIFVTSFGLVGTARNVVGGWELAVGTGDGVAKDVAALEPAILRNELPAGDVNEANRIVNRLNKVLDNSYATVAAVYEFVYDDPKSSASPVTGITWPAPVMK